MRFILNRLKAAQAAAHLAKLHDGRINFGVLIKLLYLADRTALIERGSPITGDQMVSMPHGPVLSQIYDSITSRPDGDPWCEYFTDKDGHDVYLTGDLEVDELSNYELKLLSGINEKYGHLTWNEIRNFTHGLPEWVDPRGSSLPIDPKTILRAAGKDEAEIERLSQTADEVSSMRQVLHGQASAY